jgi:hypothetical protein
MGIKLRKRELIRRGSPTARTRPRACMRACMRACVPGLADPQDRADSVQDARSEGSRVPGDVGVGDAPPLII